MPRWLFFRAFSGTNATLATLDFAYLGATFVSVPAKLSIDLSTLDYAYLGAPFVSYARG